MKVAAVIPAYNAARFIGQAIDSVYAQTRPVDTLVIVDDGSQDETAAIVASRYPAVLLVRQPNGGPAAARNLGARLVEADLIAFLDADDQWLPGTVAALHSVFKQDSEVALAAADMTGIDECGRIIVPSWFATKGLAARVAAWRGGPIPRAAASLLQRNFVGTSAVMVRADVFRSLHGFREDLRYGEDLEFWVRIAARYPVVCLPQVLGLRRSHSHNTTKATERLLLDLVRMSEIVRDWGTQALREQGLDADALVAAARTDLGYWYFDTGRFAEARRTLLAALRARPTPRALRYLALSYLPPAAVLQLRRIKASLHV